MTTTGRRKNANEMFFIRYTGVAEKRSTFLALFTQSVIFNNFFFYVSSFYFTEHRSEARGLSESRKQ